ncbi:hypothetical protein [Paraburkholderia strydomiana]|uniref:hypothetical protein n=1 Tax=Paraburkholderia strydomiana TaxID=1245417 RepID=UPI0038BC6287
MAIEFDTPLNLYRANVGLALRIVGFGHDVRQQACDLEMQRIKRDVAALNATREATIRAREWSDLASSYQAALRDYMATTTNLWQQALVSAARQQTAHSDGMRDALAQWQSAWTNNWHRSTGIDPVSTPLQDWFQRLEQLVGGALDGRGPAARYVATNLPSVGANGRGPQGEHHGG